MNLSEGLALVTGGSSGIGKETARLLVSRGAKVVVCGRDRAKLETAAAEIGAVAIAADVSSERDVTRLFGGSVAAIEGLNLVVNNAGFGAFRPLRELTVGEMRSVWETNVLGAMLVAREAARHFIERGIPGNIVNVASTAARRGFAGGTAYVASKFALAGMTECWRAELRGHDIRVMQINPSEVQTEFFATSGLDRRLSERKLRGSDIARAIASMLEMEDRALVTEMTVWATNPDS
ncbi:MAG TPA: SDR family oxidoreductase [Thermoanaerobaculia bacterium]|nr:SDR family oxidoreductase [Thermoanaerobaculia bacterium]